MSCLFGCAASPVPGLVIVGAKGSEQMKPIQLGLVWSFLLGACAIAAGGNAPYPPSKVITGIRFDRSTLVKAAPGSDQFGYTTASDGNVYVFWGDGGGFGGTNSRGRASLGVGRILGMPPAWKGANVWGGVEPLAKQPPTPGKPSNGAISVDGTMYLYICHQGVWTDNTLWKSADLGMTWRKVGQLFKEPRGAFADPGVIQFGPDYRGARDRYVYGYDEHFFEDGLALFRVDKTKLEDRSSYEFFAGFDRDGKPQWSADIEQKQRVFIDPKGTEWGVTCTYNPYLKRYLLAVRHNGESGDWGLFDAPEPWGPWTTVGYGKDFPDWVGAKDPHGASKGRPAYLHNFPQEWMGKDGTTLWHISDRGDQFNIVKAVLTLANPPKPHPKARARD
jgi:hypothetical protein